MKDVFNKNNYIDKFQSVFGENAQNPILTGRQHLVKLEVDIQSKYLTDRTEVSGNFWYGKLMILKLPATLQGSTTIFCKNGKNFVFS